ncbi:ACT domain-containing protein [Saccharomonospora saliphila]|uniref:ACT domain-containing protein n=1 Tax=Saccharomonospora saliphila TaxID=369829 RepID=UPI00036FDF5C|nr:ACT domain-containing protein [Saccharomonospora saliphila]
MRKLTVDLRPGEYAVARLHSTDAVPAALLAPGDGALVSVTRTGEELSVVCPVDSAPDGARVEAGWRLLTVRGPLAFTLTGIMAALSNELAAAGVSLFALSTYDTDHLLVRADDLDRAVAALREAGHEVPGV